MKTEVSLLVEEDLLKKAQEHAQSNETDLSSMVESFFSSIADVENIDEENPKNIMDLIRKLPKANIPDDLDLKKVYHEEMAKKYGA